MAQDRWRFNEIPHVVPFQAGYGYPTWAASGDLLTGFKGGVSVTKVQNTGTVTLLTGQSYSGPSTFLSIAQSTSATNNGAWFGASATDYWVPVSPNTEYTYSIDWLCYSGSSSDKIQLSYKTAAGSVTTSSVFSYGGSGLTTLTWTFTTGSGVNQILLGVANINTANRANFFNAFKLTANKIPARKDPSSNLGASLTQTLYSSNDIVAKEGQGCLPITGASGAYAPSVSFMNSSNDLYSDFYFYTSSSATSNYNIVATSANSSSYTEDPDPTYGFYQTDYYTTYTSINVTSSGAVSLVYYEDDYVDGYFYYFGETFNGYVYQNSGSTPITTLSTNKWYRCKVLFDVMGVKSIGIFSGTNINGITPDYTGSLSLTYAIGNNGDYANNRVFGQTNGVVASPQIGGYLDDLILSDSPIVRKKPFVGIAKP